MGDNDSDSKAQSELRRRAEEKYGETDAEGSFELDALTPEAAAKLLHELRVHQIELEMQNEELRRTQAQLELSRERYFELYDLAPIGYITIGEKGLIIECNLSAAMMLGVPKKLLIQKPFFRFIFKDDQDKYYRYRKNLDETRGISVWEMRMQKPDGSIFWTQISAAIFEDRDTRENLCRAVLSNISERKAAEEAQRRQSSLLRHVIEGSNSQIYVKDRNLKVVLCNQKYASAVSKTPEELLGKTDLESGWSPEIVKGNAEKNIRGFEADDKAALEGETIRASEEWVDAKGETCFFDTVKHPLRDEEGQVYGVVSVSQDISDQKRAEAERIRSQKLESIGFLAAGIAHDFNNILTVITGSLSLAYYDLENKADPLLSIREAEQATVRACELTRQLLTFSKGGAPCKQLTFLPKLIQESIDFARHGSSVKFELALAPDLYSVEVDTGQISQVLNNIVINAIQAMPDGGNILIKAENTELEERNGFDLPMGAYIKISIRDNGLGISPEVQKRVFEPYFTTKPLGSGLGLPTSSSIVRRHGGKIMLDSEPGKGSVFTIYLPARKDAPVDLNLKETKLVQGEGCILVMDDEEAIRLVVSQMLHKLGYTVESVRNGTEAVEHYRRRLAQGKAYSAVILDLTVPGEMGGEQAIRELLKIDPNIKAIAVSGYAENPVMANYKDYHFAATLAKPFRLNDLSQVLSALISKRDPA